MNQLMGFDFYKRPRQNEYFRQKVFELISSLRQVESLIKKQNLYQGLVVENILRSFMQSVVPKRIGVSQGFVENQGDLSPQCDIILYDQMNYAPIYSFGEIAIIPSVSVVAIIEVKKTIDKNGFAKVLTDFEKLDSMGIRHKYLFVFNGKTIKTIEKYFKYDCVPPSIRERDYPYDHDNFYSLPQSIVSISPDYYLRQGYVITDERDMMGYVAYGVIDNTGGCVTSLQTFMSELMNLTSIEHNWDDLNSVLSAPSRDDETADSLKDLKIIGEFGLYDM